MNLEQQPLKFYVDNIVTGGLSSIPKDDSILNAIMGIKTALVDGFPYYYPMRNDGRKLYFDEKYIISEYILYEITDGINTIISECQQIDDLTIEVLDDISILDFSKLKIKITSPTNWLYVDNGDSHDFSNGYSTIRYFLDGRRQIIKGDLKTSLSVGALDTTKADQFWVDSKPVGDWCIFMGDDAFICRYFNTNRMYYFQYFVSNNLISYINGYFGSNTMTKSSIYFSLIINGNVVNNIKVSNESDSTLGSDVHVSYRPNIFIQTEYRNLNIPYMIFQVGRINTKLAENDMRIFRLDGNLLFIAKAYTKTTLHIHPILLSRL